MKPANNLHARINSYLFLIIITFSVSGNTQETDLPSLKENYPANVYWGDTHLHTNLSIDAYTYGDRLGLEETYRFAKGQEVIASSGIPARLNRPLDFLVITDHAGSLGVMHALQVKDPNLLKSDITRRMSDQLSEINKIKEESMEKRRAMSELKVPSLYKNDADNYKEFNKSVWQQVTASADKHNEPGKFTAFIGYEWTSFGPAVGGFTSWHRNVVFKDSAEKANQIVPLSAYDSADPEVLWAFLNSYEERTGGEVLAIPHNGNLSLGGLFELKDMQGNPFDAAYATSRSRWEPLVETTQIKGDSEAHPILSPTDEFADFETLDKFSKPEDLPYEYSRSALKLGLEQQEKLGVNPFKFGVVGSSDAHTSLPAIEENNYWGKVTILEPSSKRSSIYPWKTVTGALAKAEEIQGWQLSASGYAAVWAIENTRDALFAAMKRKETYATTGPRMVVRFFGGWDYQPADLLRTDFAANAYRKGVPMGGDLIQAEKGKAPSFLIHAAKDSDGANLDRIQVIKGWRDNKGELHEEIYDVALSDHRKIDPVTGKAPPVGNTVNIKEATYTNDIGEPELAVVWTDPDFNPEELAFYYVRVLEIPTPRWTAYDAKAFAVKDINPEIPMVLQERAYTSSIWYTPNNTR